MTISARQLETNDKILSVISWLEIVTLYSSFKDIFVIRRPTIMFIIFWHFLMVEEVFLSPQVKRSLIINDKGWYTYDINENCSMAFSLLGGLISLRKKKNLSHLRPKFFDLFELGRQFQMNVPLQMITNQLKENIIRWWLLYVIRSFLQVGFRFQ